MRRAGGKTIWVAIALIAVVVSLMSYKNRLIRYQAEQLVGKRYMCGEAVVPPVRGVRQMYAVDADLAERLDRFFSGIQQVDRIDPAQEDYSYAEAIEFFGVHLCFYPTFFVDNGLTYVCRDYDAFYAELCELAKMRSQQ